MPVDDVLLIPFGKYTAVVTRRSRAGEAQSRSSRRYRLSSRPGRDTKVAAAESRWQRGDDDGVSHTLSPIDAGYRGRGRWGAQDDRTGLLPGSTVCSC